VLQWSGSLWVCSNASVGTITGVTAGKDLKGGGTSGNVTLNLDITKVPQLNTANTFTRNQTVNGNLSATGLVTGSSFQIGSNLFAFGSYTRENAFLGFAGNTATTGVENTATGFNALSAATTGFNNTAIGYDALLSDTTGSDNTAIGSLALYHNTGDTSGNGLGNTAAGAGALESNRTGDDNTGTGLNALVRNTTGNFNTGAGVGAGLTLDISSITGSSNTFLGTETAMSTGTLNNATAIGANAEVDSSNAMVLGSINGVNGATASTKVGIGTTSPAATLDVHGTGNFTGLITFASGQTFPGTGTITRVTPGTDLTGGGSRGNVTLNVDTTKVVTGIVAGTDLTGGGTGGVPTLNLDTTKVPQLGTANVFTGTQTVDSGDLAIITGNLDLPQTTNSTMGVVNMGGIPVLHACCATTDHNTYVGANAGSFNNGNGGNNSAFGYGALQNLATTSGSNTAVGSLAMNLNILGSSDVAVGAGALQNNTSGTNNTGVGAGVLNQTSTGSLNTALGQGAGTQNADGSNNTFIGANAGPNNTSLTFATAIGANATVGESNALVLGGTAVNVGIGTATPTNVFTIAQNAGHAIGDGWDTYSSRRWKTNIHTLHGALAKVEQLRGVSYDLKESGKHEVGVIAEEVGTVVPEIVSWEKNGKDAQGVDYSRLTALLIEATKEQQALIRKQSEQIRMQQRQMSAQQVQIRQLTSQVETIQATLKTDRGVNAEVRTAGLQVPAVVR
jgi:hypothetical protein